MPAWVQAIGALIAIIVAISMWCYDRWRDRRESDSRALSFAISLRPVLERAQYRISAESDRQAAWNSFDEHADDPNEALKILPGLPGLLSEAHLLPPHVARPVQSFWAEAQKHDALVDKNERAHALQTSDRDRLRSDLKESWPVLEETVRRALSSVQAYANNGVIATNSCPDKKEVSVR